LILGFGKSRLYWDFPWKKLGEPGRIIDDIPDIIDNFA